MDSNPDPLMNDPDPTPTPPTSDLGTPEPEAASPAIAWSAGAPPDGPGEPPVANAGGASPRWRRRGAAVGAALAILVGVGFAGHYIDNAAPNTQASQPIPQPASSGVTAKS
ncbi:MAG TPA: hypothetical protein VI138_08390, partial [Candidatus Dormibacteraeota bacterium]